MLNFDAVLRSANREVESMALAGLDAGDLLTDEERAAGVPAPLVGLAALEAELIDALAEVRRVMAHTHQWNTDDYCAICGADGRA